MKLYLKTKNVLDERETQEMYRIEHRGMWGMYALLCAAVVAADALWRGLCAGRGRGVCHRRGQRRHDCRLCAARHMGCGRAAEHAAAMRSMRSVCAGRDGGDVRIA